MAENNTGVIIGADTHKRSHTVALIASTGLELAAQEFEANAKGYKDALAWACSFGEPLRAGIESTGSYGAGLCSYLIESGIMVYDVYSPDKKRRRLKGKDDVKDAFQAAQAALSYTRCAQAKDRNEAVSAVLALENAYCLCVRQRTACINALKAEIVKLPDAMRARLEPKRNAELFKACAALRVTEGPASGTRLALRHYAKQILSLDKEASFLGKEVKRYAEELLPNTMELVGVGPHNAVTFLGAAGPNIGRLKTSASFVMLCGSSPVPASTGDTHHYRLNRGGNRKANSALYIMAITRMKLCEKTQAYIAKKMSEGKSKDDGIRALKTYLAREVYNALMADLAMLGLVS